MINEKIMTEYEQCKNCQMNLVNSKANYTYCQLGILCQDNSQYLPLLTESEIKERELVNDC